MLKKKPCCPKCGSLDVVAIMYGYRSAAFAATLAGVKHPR